MGKRGSVLVQVLMTAVVVAIIAAGLMQMLLLRSTVVARSSQGVSARKRAESYFNTVMTAWNAANWTCVPVPGYACSGCTNPPAPPPTCSCSYTTPEGTSVSSSGLYPRCALTLVAFPP